VRALEPLRGIRVVARPEAIDAATVPADAVVLRFAPDEAFVVGAGPVDLDDTHAIVVDDVGFSAARVSWADYDEHVAPLIEWPLPNERPALAQGLVAAVPAKLWITRDDVLLICPSAYADDLAERLR